MTSRPTYRDYPPLARSGFYGGYDGYRGYPGYPGYGGYGYPRGGLYPGQYAPPAREGYSEFIPIERSYRDYVPEYRVEYRPVEQRYLDYQEVRHEVDYVPVPRVSYDYVPEERTYMAGTTNNLALARSRVDYPYRNDPYINNPLLRSTSPGPYRTTGYGSSYYSPYKYL